MLNVGPTRADTIPGLEKIEVPSGVVLRDVVRNLACVVPMRISEMWTDSVYSGSRTMEDPILQRFLTSGVVKPPAREESNEDITVPHVEK